MTADWTILHAGSLGDLVLTLQLALRLCGPGDGRPLRVISRVDPGDLSGCRPSILRHSSEELGLHWLFADHDGCPSRLLGELVRGRRVLNALTAADTIVERKLELLRPAAVYSVDVRARPGVNRHITEQWQSQLEAQGLLVPKCIHHKPRQHGLGVPEELRRRGLELLGGRRAAVIHPGSGGKAKCWSLGCFLELAGLVERRLAAATCFLVGPVEAETWDPAELSLLKRGSSSFCCPKPDELVAILAAARVFIGNDAGPTHLAALLGTPTVAIFGPTSPAVWRPLGPRVEVLAGRPGWRADDWGIEPGQVADRVASLL